MKQNLLIHPFLFVAMLLVVITGCEKDEDDINKDEDIEKDSENINNLKTFTDSRDGNVYKYVTIGDQVWMAENLAYLPEITYEDDWGSYTEPQYAVYDYAPGGSVETLKGARATANYKTYGVLYNWPAAMNACPDGWHLPSDEEWYELQTHLGGENFAGGKLKEIGTEHWNSPNDGATNEVGFTALPGGRRKSKGTFGGITSIGGFENIGVGAYYWSATESYYSRFASDRHIYTGFSSLNNIGPGKDRGHSVRCMRNEDDILFLSTIVASDITTSSAICGGNITSDGGKTVIARGVCWSTTVGPTINEKKTEDGTGTGRFTSTITGLIPRTRYYVRAYATNSTDTVYGREMTFMTQEVSRNSFTDSRDGAVYQTVTIGDQEWMAENLRYLPSVSSPERGSLTAPYFYVHGYWGEDVDAAKEVPYYGTYGVLYNWTAAMNEAASSIANPSGVQGVCPDGWHLPSNAEWEELIDFLGGTYVAGRELKAISSDWNYATAYYDMKGTNNSGFTAHPNGFRIHGNTRMSFDSGSWWSTNEHTREEIGGRMSVAWNTTRATINPTYKDYGFPVRCVKN